MLNEDAGVGVEAGKGEDRAVVDAEDFANRAGLLEFGNSAFLDGQDDAVVALDANDGRSAADGLPERLDYKRCD